jgi:hypothetical protein
MLCYKVRGISKLRYESFWIISTGLVEWLRTAKCLFKYVCAILDRTTQHRNLKVYMTSRVPLCTGSRTGPSKAKHSSVVGGVRRQRQKNGAAERDVDAIRRNRCLVESECECEPKVKGGRRGEGRTTEDSVSSKTWSVGLRVSLYIVRSTVF